MYNNTKIAMIITILLFANDARSMENIQDNELKQRMISHRDYLHNMTKEAVKYILEKPINAQFLKIMNKELSDFSQEDMKNLQTVEKKVILIDQWITLIGAHQNNDPYILARHVPSLFTKKTINVPSGRENIYHYPAYGLLDSKALNRAVYTLDCTVTGFIHHITNNKLKRCYYTEFTENTYSYANEEDPLFVRVNGKNYIETHYNDRDPVVFIAKDFWEDAFRPDFQLYNTLGKIEQEDFLKKTRTCASEVAKELSFITNKIKIRNTDNEILENNEIIKKFFVDFTPWYTEEVKKFEEQRDVLITIFLAFKRLYKGPNKSFAIPRRVVLNHIMLPLYPWITQVVRHNEKN